MSQYACPDCGKVKETRGLCDVCELQAKIDLTYASFVERRQAEDEEEAVLEAEKPRGFGKRWR